MKRIKELLFSCREADISIILKIYESFFKMKTITVFLILTLQFKCCVGDMRERIFNEVSVAMKGVIIEELPITSLIGCARACMNVPLCEGFTSDSGICQVLTGPHGTGNIKIYKSKIHFNAVDLFKKACFLL